MTMLTRAARRLSALLLCALALGATPIAAQSVIGTLPSRVGTTGLVYGPVNGPAVAVTTTSGLPIAAARIDPMPWTDGTVAQDLRAYKDIEIQVAGLSGGDTITVTRSLNGTDYLAQAWIDQGFATGTTIGGNGTYKFDGSGYLKWSKTGTASTPSITLRGSN